MTNLAGGGTNMGTATGSIVLNTSQMQAAVQTARSLAQQLNQAMNSAGSGAGQATTGIDSLTKAMGRLGGAVGIATGAGLVVQLGQIALQSDAAATAYRRQSVAAVSLAGSQAKLNELLATYNKATGNVIDKGTAMADVTKLQAVGFADSAKELEKFTIAARGISVAMGRTQEYVIGQLQLAIANQSLMRLDQIGLGVEEVQAKIKELRAADESLTKAQAYQNAVLTIATQKYGALAKSMQAQATGAESAAKAWKELQLQLGETLGPVTGGVMGGMAKELNGISAMFQALGRDIAFLKAQLADQGWSMPQWLKGAMGAGSGGATGQSLEEIYLRGNITTRQNRLSHLQADRQRTTSSTEIAQLDTQIRAVNAELGQFKAALLLARGAASQLSGGLDMRSLPQAVAPGGRTDEQKAAIQQWAADVRAIEREAGTARLEATRQYEQQRAEAISSYGRQTVREEEDFARSRARAFADYARQVADIQEDAAKREADAIRSYTRAVAEVREDAAKRDSKWQADYDERLADIREAGNERLQELEENYNKSREDAAEEHRDRLFDAAGRLDAIAVRNEQKNYAKQQQDAEENYTEQRAKIKEAMAEQLADAQEAQQERLAEAHEADRERLADMQEAHEEQLARARENDAERLADMQEDFARRLAEEDEERAIQNARRAEDHAAEMAQMAAAQAERMAQINAQEAQEKAALQESFLKELEELGLYNANWLKLQKAQQEASLKMFDDWWKEIQKRFAIQGPQPEPTTKPTFPQDWQTLIDQANMNVGGEGMAKGGPVTRTGRTLIHAGEYVLNPQTTAALRSQLGGFDQRSLVSAVAGGNSRSITFGNGAVVIHAAAGTDPMAIGREVRREIEALLREAAA